MNIIYNGKNFKEVLKALRRALDMNQEQFVDYLKGKGIRISLSSVAKYESGAMDPFSEYSRIVEIKHATSEICTKKAINLVIDQFQIIPEAKNVNS